MAATLNDHQAAPTAGNLPLALPFTPQEIPEVAFLNLAEPLIEASRSELLADLSRYDEEFPNRPIGPAELMPHFDAQLPELLTPMLTPTLVLELNVARLQDRLAGDDSAARFHSFTQLLRDDAYRRQLFGEYPVLAEQLATACRHWASANSLFARRLYADFPRLADAFGLPAGDRVQAVHASAGDSHCGGLSVLIVEWQSGTKVVYKPRSLAIDGHFQRLLQWLNGRGEYPAILKTRDNFVQNAWSRRCLGRTAYRRNRHH